MTPSEILDKIIEIEESEIFHPLHKERQVEILNLLKSYKELREALAPISNLSWSEFRPEYKACKLALLSSDQLLKSLVNEK